MDTQARDLLETVRRREAVLACLDGTSRNKRELTRRLDVSRQTVDRAIRELESATMVRRVDDGYRLTLFGDLVYREFESLLERFERLRRARGLVAHLPADTRIDADVLAGAEIVHADHPMPHEPVRRLEGLVEDADRLVGYSPIAFPQYVSLVHRQATRTDTEIELFLDDPLVEGLWSDYGDELREALSSPNFTLCQLAEPFWPNMGLAVLDGSSVWLGVYDETGNIRGAIITDDDAALSWARDRLEECRANARELSPRSSSER